jgi:hypothetical protein
MSKSVKFSFFTFRTWSMRMATTLVGLLFACGVNWWFACLETDGWSAFEFEWGIGRVGYE